MLVSQLTAIKFNWKPESEIKGTRLIFLAESRQHLNVKIAFYNWRDCEIIGLVIRGRHDSCMILFDIDDRTLNSYLKTISSLVSHPMSGKQAK